MTPARGLLYAAAALGAVLATLTSGRLGGVRRQGLAIMVSIVGWGVGIIGLGVALLGANGWLTPTQALWGALLAMAFAGAADAVSAVFRTTILQSAAPDRMRGRLQGVFIVVVTGGPRVGDLYTGLLASLALLWLPPLAGGLAIVLILAAVLRLSPRFRRYDALHPVA